MGLLAVLFWGTTIAFSRSLTEQLGIITAGGYVFMVSALFSWFYLLITSSKKFKEMIKLPPSYVWGCGILFVVYMTCLYLAIGLSVSREQVVVVSIINYLWPGLTILFSIPILNNRAKWTLFPGIVLGFWGAYLAMNPYRSFSLDHFLKAFQSNTLPYFLAMIAAVSWALYSTLAKKWAGNVKDGAVPLFLFCTGVILMVSRLFFQEQSIWQIKTGLELLYMAIFPTFLAYFFWDRAMRRGNMIFVASFSYFTPLLSVFTTAIYLEIAIDMRLWIACILVVIGAVISKISIIEI